MSFLFNKIKLQMYNFITIKNKICVFIILYWKINKAII